MGSVVLMGAVLLGGANSALAVDGWHLTPAIMGGATRIGSTRDTGQIGTGALINGMVDGAFDGGATWDSAAGAALELGYAKDRMRYTAAFSWQFRNDWDLAAPTPSLATVTNVFTNIERAAYLVGAHYRVPLGPRWQFEAGLGGGVVVNKLRTDYKIRAAPGISPARLNKNSSSQRTRGLFAQVGFSYRLRARLFGGVHYRYLDTGRVEITPIENESTKFRTRLQDHLLVFSLRYQLR